MDVSSLFLEFYGRIPPLAEQAVVGLGPDELVRTAVPGTNPIGWLVWHSARVQDHHLSELLEAEQLWATGEWAASFGLDADPDNTGYGHRPDDVAAVRPTGPDAVLSYLAATQERAVQVVSGVDEASLDRIVDRSWDPPVTLGVRLVSVADDGLQHVGQANYLRGQLGL